MQFQDRLYQLRKERGLSQENLADMLGVTRQAVQKWEAGASRPDMDNLTALARCFDVTLDWLITGVEPVIPRENGPVQQTVINNYYRGWSYEYRSRRTLFGLPLVHINLRDRGLSRAKGIFAVGNVATGVISIGAFSFGGVALGAVNLGVISVGALAVGLFSLGALAVGGLACGAMSLGVLALGGIAKGVFAAGSIASASQIAIGNIASAPLAIGDQAEGAVTLLTDGSASLDSIRAAIEQSASHLPQCFKDFLTFMAAHIHSTPLT